MLSPLPCFKTVQKTKCIFSKYVNIFLDLIYSIDSPFDK